MRLPIYFVCFAVGSLLVTNDARGSQRPAAHPSTSPSCDVTTPAGTSGTSQELGPDSYGSERLAVALPTNGTVVFRPGGPGFKTSDGSLGMKFGWARGVRGRLRIEGHRLDGAASPLQANIPEGYGDSGFQATALIFPTPGCWEVTGRVGEASLTFVTMVMKIGDGPAWRWNPPPVER